MKIHELLEQTSYYQLTDKHRDLFDMIDDLLPERANVAGYNITFKDFIKEFWSYPPKVLARFNQTVINDTISKAMSGQVDNQTQHAVDAVRGVINERDIRKKIRTIDKFIKDVEKELDRKEFNDFLHYILGMSRYDKVFNVIGMLAHVT